MAINMYKDPLVIKWWTDNFGNKISVSRINEPHKVVNNKITLDEIPDENYKVIIQGLFEKKIGSILDVLDFMVNYTTGEITFHPLKEGQTINIQQYYSRGLICYPSSRIYCSLDNNGNIVETIDDYIEKITTSIEYANSAVESANSAASYAETKGQYANTQAIYAKNSGDYATNTANSYTDVVQSTKLVYKPYVNTYSNISSTYPSPSIGWTTVAIDTGIRYRYDGASWIPIDITGSGVQNITPYLLNTTFSHNLNKYPNVFVIRGNNGYGINGYGSSHYGGENSNSLFCSVEYINLNQLKLSLSESFSGSITINQNQNQYLVSFSGDTKTLIVNIN